MQVIFAPLSIKGMNITIDIGNSRAKIGLFDGLKLVHFQNCDTINTAILSKVIAERIPSGQKVNTIISSVAGTQFDWEPLLHNLGKVFWMRPGIRLPILIDYKTPETLGSDRIAVAIAAAHRYQTKNILVFQAGSCLTHEFIREGKIYEGGGISPGLNMRFKALHTFTGRLPLINYKEIDFLPGKTTEESILNGVINGMAAEIDGTIDRYRKNWDNLVVVITGGDLMNFDKRLKNSIFALPNLVLEGLNIIIGFNENLP